MDGYVITSFIAAAVNAARGTLPLDNTAAAQPAPGSLVAAFQASLPAGTGGTAAFVYATGAAGCRRLRAHGREPGGGVACGGGGACILS